MRLQSPASKRARIPERAFDAHEFMQASGQVGGRLDPTSRAHPGFFPSRHSCPQDNPAREEPLGLWSVLTAAPPLSLPLIEDKQAPKKLGLKFSGRLELCSTLHINISISVLKINL